MSNVTYRKDHDGGTYCPLASVVCRQWTACIEDACEWWTNSSDRDFSCCALVRMTNNTSTMSYRMARGE